MKSEKEIINEALTERFDLEEIEQYKALKQEYRANPVRRLADSVGSFMLMTGFIQASMWYLLICLLIDLAKNNLSRVGDYVFVAQLPLIAFTVFLILIGRFPKPGGIPFNEFIHRIFGERTTVGAMVIVSVMAYVGSLVLLCALCLAGVI